MKNLLNYKKELIAGLVSMIILGGLIILAGKNIGNTNVKFEVVHEKQIPREISSEILPEYRNLERAMACICEDQVFVIVTRGEKPSPGYEVEITKITLESKKDKTKLKVYANFVDPENSENLPQVLTYPVAVAKAHITGLPDNIELISEFVE